jgi:hypothetical protein
LAEPRHHVARQPFQRLLILLLLACRFDQVTIFGVLQQPPGDLLRGNEALMLPIRLLDIAGDDREDISLFPLGLTPTSLPECSGIGFDPLLRAERPS